MNFAIITNVIRFTILRLPFFSNQILVLELEKLVKQPTNASVRGPLWLWYYQLLMPTVAYFLAVMLTLIMSEKKGIVILLVLANIIRVSRNASHRITHCSRYILNKGVP